MQQVGYVRDYRRAKEGRIVVGSIQSMLCRRGPGEKVVGVPGQVETGCNAVAARPSIMTPGAYVPVVHYNLKLFEGVQPL